MGMVQEIKTSHSKGAVTKLRLLVKESGEGVVTKTWKESQ